MTIRKNLMTKLALTALTFTITAIWTIGPVAQMQSESRTQGSATLYGMHSLSAGRTARLTVVNSNPPDSVRGGEIIPCFLVGFVFDVYEPNPTDPARLRFVRRVERTVRLEPAEAASFDFTSRTGDYISAAAYSRPVSDGDEDLSGPVPMTAVATLEVREGVRTLFTLPGVIRGFDPQPDPPVSTPR